MNILISVNEKFFTPVEVLLKSISINVKEQIDVYFMYHSLPKSYVEKLDKFCSEKCGAKFHPVYIETNFFDDLPIEEKYSVETWFRLVAPFILPSEVERILWLDADMIVNKDLTSFYNSNFCDKSIIVAQEMSPEEVQISSIKRLNMQKDSKYFNAGMVLFNLVKIRQNWTKNSIFQLITNIKDILTWADQDVLNVMFDTDKIVCSNDYNFQLFYKSWRSIDDVNKAFIIHYYGFMKPWNKKYVHEAKWIYWKYYCMAFGKGKYYKFKLQNKYEMTINRVYRKLFHKER